MGREMETVGAAPAGGEEEGRGGTKATTVGGGGGEGAPPRGALGERPLGEGRVGIGQTAGVKNEGGEGRVGVCFPECRRYWRATSSVQTSERLRFGKSSRPTMACSTATSTSKNENLLAVRTISFRTSRGSSPRGTRWLTNLSMETWNTEC